MKKTAEVKWAGGMQFIGKADSNVPMVIGSTEYGEGAMTSPMELVLLGLCGCTAMDVAHILKRRRQEITDLRVTVDAERAETHPKVYTACHLKYTVRGRNLSEKAVMAAVKLTRETYCSVSAMLEKTATVTHDVEIIEESEQPNE
ncbi:MAG: OsmC family protein [Deferribacteres bacterium]|nr:OsmC family protein [candidate division KSB1 bacterium]MCB9504323.1 OsmC family protein [Deferribacteres bacterium]